VCEYVPNKTLEFHLHSMDFLRLTFVQHSFPFFAYPISIIDDIMSHFALYEIVEFTNLFSEKLIHL
jgi:hypothetical protein